MERTYNLPAHIKLNKATFGTGSTQEVATRRYRPSDVESVLPKIHDALIADGFELVDSVAANISLQMRKDASVVTFYISQRGLTVVFAGVAPVEL